MAVVVVVVSVVTEGCCWEGFTRFGFEGTLPTPPPLPAVAESKGNAEVKLALLLLFIPPAEKGEGD